VNETEDNEMRGWSRNPEPRFQGTSAELKSSDFLAKIESLECRVDAERRSVETLGHKLREMTTAYHELLDREGEAIEGIAYAMLERPVDMGLLEYVSDLDAYTRKLRLENEELKRERDNHLQGLMRASLKFPSCSICRRNHGPEIRHACE
jgi:hypothetical protein